MAPEDLHVAVVSIADKAVNIEVGTGEVRRRIKEVDKIFAPDDVAELRAIRVGRDDPFEVLDAGVV